MRNSLTLALGVALLACGPKPQAVSSGSQPAAAVDEHTQYGALDVGADYATYRKVTKFPHLSQTHGQRFVEIYVNDVGFDAYTGDSDFPAGTTIVKISWENDDGEPSQTPGPVFVMQKREPGYAPDHEDWYYAIHWAEPTEKMRKSLGGPVYWRSPSNKVDYCWKCHENYDREVGLPPLEARAWQPASAEE